jgi:hypothetical protein
MSNAKAGLRTARVLGMHGDGCRGDRGRPELRRSPWFKALMGIAWGAYPDKQEDRGEHHESHSTYKSTHNHAR